MLLFSILLYLVTALLACTVVFQKLTFSKILISFFITTFAINVLVGEFLSLIRQLNNAWFYLAAQLVFCAALSAVLVIKNNIKWRVLVQSNRVSKGNFRSFEYILLGLISVSLAVLFYVGINTPPNNLDSLHTHLTRIYYWLQHGSLVNWSATGLFQLNYPINAHLQGLWLVLLGGKEQLFFLVPWFSLVTICCTVYEISRRLDFSEKQSLVGVLVLLCFPVVLLQTYSFQNDLTVVALAAIAVWSLLNYQKSKRLVDLAGVLLALALALGVKQTAFFVLPIFLISAIFMLVKKQVEKKHLVWLSLFVAFFLVFSSFKYMQNLAAFHSFFGVEDVLSEQDYTLRSFAEKTRYNAPRFLYDFIDFAGLGERVETRLNGVKASVFEKLTSRSGIDLQSERYLPAGHDASERFSFAMGRALSEDTSWFGPLLILVPVSLLVVFIQKNKPRKSYTFFALLHFFLYFLLIIIQRPGWDPYQGRYFILGIIPFVPLIGAVLPARGIGKWAVSTVLCVIYIIISFNVLAMNASKPLVTARTVAILQNETILPLPDTTRLQIISKTYLVKWTNALVERWPQRESIFALPYYDQLYYSDTSLVREIDMIHRFIPDSAPLYLMMERTPLEYGLFGLNRTRELFPVTTFAEVKNGGFLLVDKAHDLPLPSFTLIASDDKYAVYQRSD